MNASARWTAKIGMVSGMLLGTMFLNSLSALALTPEQISQKLGPIPVFTLTDDKGAPLVSNPPQGQKANPIARVFMSQKDANTFLAKLKTDKPDIAKNLQVRPLSMAEVYDLKRKNKDKQPQLDFVYIPAKQQSDSALAIVKASGTKIEMFPGTPIFVARAGDKDKGLLTIQQGNESAIPMFFEKEQLQTFIERFKTSQPDLAKSADIQVLQLENILEAMGSDKKDESLEKIMLIPSNESLQFLQSLQPPAGAPAVAPAAAPKKK